MATVTNWIDHLNKPAEEVAGAIYPGAGSSETLLVILGFVLWIGWHVLTARSESEELERLSRKRHVFFWIIFQALRLSLIHI